MRYTGNKNRISKHILPIILEGRTDEVWVEPFVGGANMIDKVDGRRIGSDFNEHLIKFYESIQNGWLPPNRITKEMYIDIKNNQQRDSRLTVWAGICCSYGGKWFGGLLDDYQESKRNKNGKLPNHQDEARRGLIKQIPKLKGVEFICSDYQDLDIPNNSIIYCDPPYEGTVKYNEGINHLDFWEWCRVKTKEGHKVFISEYNAPIDFKCVWSKEVSNTLSKQKNFKNTEKLFVYNTDNNLK
jgi:DNA adenine methylase